MFNNEPTLTKLKYNFFKSPKKDFARALSSLEFFEERKVYVIELQNGTYQKDYCVNDVCQSYARYEGLLQTFLDAKHGLKIEGFESFNRNIFQFCNTLSNVWDRPVNCHAYWGFEGHGSFDMHVDDCNVVIAVVHGKKLVNVNGVEYTLARGDVLYIPPGVPHQATNLTDCLSLSFGSFDYDETVKGFLETL